MSADNVIEAKGLTKAYGHAIAVDHVSFTVGRGEIFGLLGPNGAGKTTTILMLLGLTEISDGDVSVLGFNPAREPLSVKRRVGYMPDTVGFYDQMTAVDTLTNRVIANIPIGQAPQAVTYVPNAMPETRASGNEAMSVMDGAANPEPDNLQQLGVAGQVAHFTMVPLGDAFPGNAKPLTSVSLFDQGLSQVLQAAATGLEPRHSYVLALATRPDGSGSLEPLAGFVANPAGAAIVNAIGPIRQVVRGDAQDSRRYLVIAPGSMTEVGKPVQIQAQ